MANTRLKKSALFIAIALSLSTLTANSANAMSFFNAEEHQTSATEKNLARQEMEPTTSPTPNPATPLPDKLNTIADSLSNDSDVKYYSFTAVRGQDVMINQIDIITSSPWLIEYKTDDEWKIKPQDTLILSSLQPNQEIQIRVSKKPGVPMQTGDTYEIDFGSTPYHTSYHLSGDASQLPLYWGTIQAYKIINWSMQLNDSKGHPVEGATAIMELNKNQSAGLPPITPSIKTDATGKATGVVELGSCYGSLKSDPFWLSSGKYRYQWQLEYNKGFFFIFVQGNEKSAVGSRNGINTSFAHICNQRMIR